MARRPSRDQRQRRRTPGPRPTSGPPVSGEGTARDHIIAAFLDLLAEEAFEDIGFRDIAERAGVTLADLRDEFASTLGIFAAHVKAIDRQVLSGAESEAADIEEETPRERLFDVLMRRLDLLAPYRAAVRSLMRSARRDPALGFALNGLAVRSHQWMLTAAGIDAAGPRGLMRAQGLALMFARVLDVWLNDEDPGLARTMAALDRALGRGERMVRVLDALSCIFPPRCPALRSRWRRRDGERDHGRGLDEDGGGEPAAAI